MFHIPFALISAALVMLLAPSSVAAMNDACNDWVDAKPYLTDFYQLEQPQLDNLVHNFNAAPPRSDLRPQLVGYTWKTGWDLVQLVMFDDGCLVLDLPYPRLTIWAMMKDYPAPDVLFDKSAKTYTFLVDEQLAKEEANFERARKWRAESGLDVADEDTGMSSRDEVSDEGFGELD